MTRRGRAAGVDQPVAPAPPPPAVVEVTPPRLPRPRAANSWIIAQSPDFSAARDLGDRRRQLRHGVTWQLSFSDGQTITVSGTGIVGRNPSHDGDYVHRVRIDDDRKLLSRGQFEFGVTPSGILWARDLASANGTYVALPGQSLAPLSAAQRTSLPSGTVLRFGEYSARVLTDT